MNENTAHLRTWVYHESGLKVEFFAPLGDNPGAEANQYIANLLAAGWLAEPPNPEAGDRMDVCAVVRGQVVRDNGDTVDRIYLYAPWGKPEFGSQMTVYMNTPEDRAAFEQASGLMIASLPIVKGKAGPTRQSRDFEELHKPVNMTVFRKKAREPKEGETAKDIPWELVRYAGQNTVPKAPANVSEPDFTPPPPADDKPTTLKNGSGNTFNTPIWWNDVFKAIKDHPHFATDKGKGTGYTHVANWMKKQMADGLIAPDAKPEAALQAATLLLTREESH